MLGPYEINDIYQTDCVEGLKKLPENCIDLCVSSPPYDGIRDYHGFSLDLGYARSNQEFCQIINYFQNCN